jgi:hypothetical protein
MQAREQTMTKANIVLAATALVFGGSCLVLFKDNGTQRNRVRALEAQVAQLQREFTAARASSQPATSDTAAASNEPFAQGVTQNPAGASPPSRSSAPSVAKPAADANNELRAVLADPAYRRARIAEARLQLQRDYPQLVAALGLSGDEAERFLDLLAEQTVREYERAMKQQSGQDSMQWRRELSEQAEKERRAFLGEERFRTWVEYVNSANARAIVSQLRTELATSSSPLREDQVKPFVKALASEHQRHAAERQENYQVETSRNGVWTEATPAAQQIEYMERRAALIQESLDRQQTVGEMYLDSVQQREFNAMLDRLREQARVELESYQAQLEATERTRRRSQ